MSYWMAGATVVSAGSSYLSAKSNKPDSSNQAYQKSLNNASSDLLDRADLVSKRAYTPYDGERVAGMGGNELKGMNLAATGYGDSKDMMGKAGQQIDDVASSQWNADTAKKYMDPYVDQVVNNTLKHENTAYEQSQNRLKGNAAAMGAFGGDRATLLESQGTQKHLQNVGDITAQGYSTAYDKAFQGWQADNQRKTQAAQAYESVGGNLAKMNSNQIQDLMQTGGADRVMRQLTDDTSYSAFIEKRDWDVNNLKPLMNAIGVSRGGGVQKDTSGADAANSTLGSIASLVGFFGSKSGGSGGGGSGSGFGSAPNQAGLSMYGM